MNDHPITICPSDTIIDAIRTVSETNVGALLIREEEKQREREINILSTYPPIVTMKLQGIVTLRDLVSVMAAYIPVGLTVGDYMTREIASINALDPISVAVQRMSVRRVRRLPVLADYNDDGRRTSVAMEGMVTNMTVLRYLESVIAYNVEDLGAALALPVKTVMTPKTPTIDPKEDCGNVLYLMRELGTGGFAVSDSRGLLGVITERDLVKRIYDRKGVGFFRELFSQQLML
jgi:CBS domain-containing protein